MDADESYLIQDHIQPSFADSCFATHFAIITARTIYRFVRKLCAYPNTLHFLLQKKYQILGQDVWGQIPMGSIAPKIAEQAVAAYNESKVLGALTVSGSTAS